MLVSGDVLDGRYQLDEQIAAGGMGAVWRATDVVLGRTVAVKVLHPRFDGDASFGDRFRAEARTVAALHHPGIVEVYDYGEVRRHDGGVLAYLVMAYIHGQSLAQRIAAAGCLTSAQTLPIIAQAAVALSAAHAAGVVHRDVKPANLLIEPDGRVILVDFGIAHTAGDASLTGAGDLVGTAAYMAPEQVARREVSAATDIYSLGAVAYHCLAGRAPFTGPNPLTIALQQLDADPPPLPSTVPGPVCALVATAMAKNPADRYPSGAHMAAAARAAGSETAFDLGRAALPPAWQLRPSGPADATTPVLGHTLTLAQPPTGRRWRAVRVLAAPLLALVAALAVFGFVDPLGAPEPDNQLPTNSPAPASTGPGHATDPALRPAIKPTAPGVGGALRPTPVVSGNSTSASPKPSVTRPATSPTPGPTTGKPIEATTAPPSSIPSSSAPSTTAPTTPNASTSESASGSTGAPTVTPKKDKPSTSVPTSASPQVAQPSTAVSAEPV
jgi:serine/threonine protein kinase